MSNWVTTKFGELLSEPLRNGIYKPKEFHGRGWKVVNMGELFGHRRLRNVAMKRVELSTDEQFRFQLQVGDLLFARRSLVAAGAGKCSIVIEVDNAGTTFESSIIRARPARDRADPQFLHYYFESSLGKHSMGSILRQVAVSGITGTDLSRLELAVPPVHEQAQIARIIEVLDDKIELNRRTNETLEAMARALFKSWFVDFDPVHAKKAGLVPAGMDSATAAMFSSNFAEIGGMVVPQGWSVCPLDEIATFINGLALQNYPASGSDSLPVIKIAEMRRGHTLGAARAATSIPERYVVKDGDVLFSWSGTLDATIWCGGKGALNQHLFNVSSAMFPRWFYFGWLLQHLAEFQAIAADKATTMGHIQRGHLTRALVAVPPEPVIERVGSVCRALEERSLSARFENNMLTSVRDALLPKLLSGELRIPEAERIVGKAV